MSDLSASEFAVPEPGPLPPPRVPGPAWLFERGPSLIRYTLRLWPLTFIPSIVLGAAVYALFSALGLSTDKPGPQLSDFGGVSRATAFFIVFVLAPMIETLLLSFGIGLISLVTRRPLVIATISAVAWGAMHFVGFQIQGIAVMWPFFVFSCAYLAWRPVGWGHAYVVALALHMLQNLLPGLGLVLMSS